MVDRLYTFGCSDGIKKLFNCIIVIEQLRAF